MSWQPWGDEEGREGDSEEILMHKWRQQQWRVVKEDLKNRRGSNWPRPCRWKKGRGVLAYLQVPGCLPNLARASLQRKSRLCPFLCHRVQGLITPRAQHVPSKCSCMPSRASTLSSRPAPEGKHYPGETSFFFVPTGSDHSWSAYSFPLCRMYYLWQCI